MATRSSGSRWSFPSLEAIAGSDDLVAVGADLEVDTLLSAYCSGYFPMPVARRQVGWFSPNPRGVFLPGDLRVSRSLRRSLSRYRVTVNEAFSDVITACGDPRRPHGWINQRIVRAYTELHHRGHAHSVEAWDDEGLAGGLYGVSIGGFFAGESMFHRRTDASKVALVHLCELLGDEDHGLLDVQWVTPHLESLGARDIPRTEFGQRLPLALALPARPPFGSDAATPPPPTPTDASNERRS